MYVITLGSETLRAAQSGCSDAFRCLYETYQPMVARTLYYLCPRDQSLADLEQEVFLKIFKKIGQFRQESQLSTWIYRITVNTAMDHVRRLRPFSELGQWIHEWFENDEQAPDTQLIRREQVGQVRLALAELSPKLQAILVLRYVEDRSYEEIGRILDIQTGTVASRLHRAHQSLARAYARKTAAREVPL
ncbi:MAG: sigma-70 family RNA polymerase sigma factor [Acidobacteria bacterium]|nr:sigma-70 family RNA polymerase sigma factor [Acidobacteriota bacterium]MCB9397766.1 sigma-70 family RNA polymerase sigma factor [Acidobacteriota bacterium]